MLFPGVKLPAPRPEPPGLETRILRSLFAWLCWGSLFIVEPSLFARLFEWNGNHINVEKTLTSIDIGVVAVLILYWTILFTLGICAGIIKVIKGMPIRQTLTLFKILSGHSGDSHWMMTVWSSTFNMSEILFQQLRGLPFKKYLATRRLLVDPAIGMSRYTIF